MNVKMNALARRVDMMEQKMEESRAKNDEGDLSLFDPSYSLSRRALNVLDRIGCSTISELRRFGINNLRRVRGCGNGTFVELSNLIQDYGRA